ncbi:hypothetical protein [Bacteroides propionicifaciens]|uniref:hypothetical protein n=1 Tax=Bacteroides propionicifaciens TaxID=392838 RepID=UPI000370A3C3|nr:hypothetical protein [Bacteroides propionicifaciens]
MKKLNLVFLLLLCTPLIYAQSFDKLVKQFIESIVILNLEECSPELLKKFDSTVRGLKIGKGYSTYRSG